MAEFKNLSDAAASLAGANVTTPEAALSWFRDNDLTLSQGGSVLKDDETEEVTSDDEKKEGEEDAPPTMMDMKSARNSAVDKLGLPE